jgi:hypothetical protein
LICSNSSDGAPKQDQHQPTPQHLPAHAVAGIFLEDHIRGCVAHGIRSGEGDAYIDEVMEIIRRYVRS